MYNNSVAYRTLYYSPIYHVRKQKQRLIGVLHANQNVFSIIIAIIITIIVYLSAYFMFFFCLFYSCACYTCVLIVYFFHLHFLDMVPVLPPPPRPSAHTN